MSKPSATGIPGFGAMTDTFDFMKNLWGGMAMPAGGMNMPGMVMPTLSVDEINKQIKDLKAVESWLSLNLNMLHGSIQALEVQASTISTLQSMSDSFTAAMKPPASAATPKAAAPAAPTAAPAFESPFAAMPSAAAPAPAPAEKIEKAAAPETPPAAATPSPNLGDAAGAVPPMANPAAWWNMLQDQFKQAVDTASAMTPDLPATSGTKAPAKAATKAAAAPAKKAASKPAKAKATPKKTAKTAARKSPPKA